jgi:hypothetical protein
MTERVFLFLIFFLPARILFSQPETVDYSECLVKVHSTWSSPIDLCPYPDNTYRVFLKNVCADTIESKVCVREKANRWRIFHFRWIAPGDSVSAYACHGTGRYLHFTRKAGDYSVILPEDNEIQKIK